MSYWDWLPLEMQEYVLRLRDSQALIDRRESQASRELCDEIEMYGRLRERWQIGFIQVKPKLRFKRNCLTNERGLKQIEYGSIFISGHYVDLRGRKRRVFLDFSYHAAIAWCHVVRSRLFSEAMEIVL